MKADRIAFLAYYGAIARYMDIQKCILNEGTSKVLLDKAQEAWNEVMGTKAYYIESLEKEGNKHEAHEHV